MCYNVIKNIWRRIKLGIRQSHNIKVKQKTKFVASINVKQPQSPKMFFDKLPMLKTIKNDIEPEFVQNNILGHASRKTYPEYLFDPNDLHLSYIEIDELTDFLQMGWDPKVVKNILNIIYQNHHLDEMELQTTFTKSKAIIEAMVARGWLKKSLDGKKVKADIALKNLALIDHYFDRVMIPTTGLNKTLTKAYNNPGELVEEPGYLFFSEQDAKNKYSGIFRTKDISINKPAAILIEFTDENIPSFPKWNAPKVWPLFVNAEDVKSAALLQQSEIEKVMKQSPKYRLPDRGFKEKYYSEFENDVYIPFINPVTKQNDAVIVNNAADRYFHEKYPNVQQFVGNDLTKEEEFPIYYIDNGKTVGYTMGKLGTYESDGRIIFKKVLARIQFISQLIK